MDISLSLYSSISSSTITFSIAGQSDNIFLILRNWPAETIIYFASEWFILNRRSLLSSSLIERGTFTPPAYKMPSSPIIQRLRPSERRATLSPFSRPSFIKPAPIRYASRRVFSKDVSSQTLPFFSLRKVCEANSRVYFSTKSIMVILFAISIIILYQERGRIIHCLSFQ